VNQTDVRSQTVKDLGRQEAYSKNPQQRGFARILQTDHRYIHLGCPAYRIVFVSLVNHFYRNHGRQTGLAFNGDRAPPSWVRHNNSNLPEQPQQPIVHTLEETCHLFESEPGISIK
jgi:hypothetical protein